MTIGIFKIGGRKLVLNMAGRMPAILRTLPFVGTPSKRQFYLHAILGLAERLSEFRLDQAIVAFLSAIHNVESIIVIAEENEEVMPQ